MGESLQARQHAVGSSVSAEPLIRVDGVTKSFGGVQALRGVGFELRPGEVHALLGENGAGKSTLIKILSGVQSHDGGSIEIAGRPVAFTSSAQSRQAGVAVVYQDLSLVEPLSVAANLMLGREPRTRLGFIRKRRLLAEVEAFLAARGIPLDPRATVGSLPFAYRQMTEISKALIGDVKILILDEPTSALTGDEERILFDAIRGVTRNGVGVIYVTHRLGEVFRISDRVTVLRDGANAGLFETSETTMKDLVAAIVGPGHGAAQSEKTKAETDHATSGSAGPPSREAILTLTGVANDRLRGADLTLRRGEIHGLAGLVGSGRTEILETIFGLRSTAAGTIAIEGAPVVHRTPSDAIAHGIALVPEDRHEQGLVLDHSIERNLTLPRLAHFTRVGWLRRAAARREADTAMRSLRVKAPNASVEVRTLSGGNQQKVVFAKWNHPRPKILMLDEPTVGVDVGAREEIYGLVRDAARDGTGVLVVSSDLTELILICDRVSIVVDGRVVATVDRGDLGATEDLLHRIQAAQTSSEIAA